MNTQSRQETLLARVKAGMVVYDANFEKLGIVTDVYFGSSTDENQGREAESGSLPVGTSIGSGLPSVGPLIAAVGNSDRIDPFEGQLQPHTRSLLVKQGFVKAKWRVFGAVWYITPDQIVTIVGDDINLNVPQNQVIRLR